MYAYWKLWVDVLNIGLDAQRVIAMRLAKIAKGGAAAEAECRRMVSEKFLAAAERVEALDFDLDFDLDLIMGSSEVMRRYPPHHLSPARAKPRQGKTPKWVFSTSKSPQQRSDRTRKPVKSEQDSCSLDSNHGLPTAGPNCNP